MGFLNSLIKSSSAPIGVDLGSAAIKLAQVTTQNGKSQLTAAASADVPPELRGDPRARIDHFAETAVALLSKGGFRGRRVVLGLPASFMHLQRVRVPLLDEHGIKQALQFELVDKLPFHPSRGLIRHVVAGEVYEDNERRSEVIVMAALRDLTDRYLNAAAKSKLQVVGVNAEPMAIAGCFALGDPQTPNPTARAYIDIGNSGTRIYVAAGRKIQFARAVPVGTSQLDVAVAHALRVDQVKARELRLRMASQSNAPASGGASGATATLESDEQDRMARVAQACRAPLGQLVEEIDGCLRYHGATFPATPIEQLVFVGGCAAQRRLCQKIAAELRIAAQVGDVFARVPPDESIDPSVYNMPSPGWAVAVGLSLGTPETAT